MVEPNIRLSFICSGSFEFKTELFAIQCFIVIKSLILLNLKQITSSSEALRLRTSCISKHSTHVDGRKIQSDRFSRHLSMLV